MDKTFEIVELGTASEETKGSLFVDADNTIGIPGTLKHN
jgi:hypothetical protein